MEGFLALQGLAAGPGTFLIKRLRRLRRSLSRQSEQTLASDVSSRDLPSISMTRHMKRCWRARCATDRKQRDFQSQKTRYPCRPCQPPVRTKRALQSLEAYVAEP